MKKRRWECLNSEKHFHWISDFEMKERLAETWVILLGLRSQQTFSQLRLPENTAHDLSQPKTEGQLNE